MIRKDKLISILWALICSIILAIGYFIFIYSPTDYFLFWFLIIPSFLLFLSIFTSIADIKKKIHIKLNIALLIQAIFGLITWISFILCFSDISNQIKTITITVFSISFILFIISFGFTNIFEENRN